MDIYDQLEAASNAIIEHLGEPTPHRGAEGYHAFADRRAQVIRELQSTVRHITGYARDWFSGRLRALEGAALDPRGVLVDDICKTFENIIDPHRHFERGYTAQDRAAYAFATAIEALGSQGIVVLHLFEQWLRTSIAAERAERTSADERTAANLERDDARRGWAIAKAGRADLDAMRNAAAELFGYDEALRLFPPAPLSDGLDGAYRKIRGQGEPPQGVCVHCAGTDGMHTDACDLSISECGCPRLGGDAHRYIAGACPGFAPGVEVGMHARHPDLGIVRVLELPQCPSDFAKVEDGKGRSYEVTAYLLRRD